ncbi:hypothetical protein IWZ03DRAFT_419592, partial [Phyllosticta citriasiana]
ASARATHEYRQRCKLKCLSFALIAHIFFCLWVYDLPPTSGHGYSDNTPPKPFRNLSPFFSSQFLPRQKTPSASCAYDLPTTPTPINAHFRASLLILLPRRSPPAPRRVSAH